MVCFPYISCNGTCFVHEIFRLDAIERFMVTIYHIVAKNGFPKIFSHFTEGLDLYCPITGFICLPKELFGIRKDLLCLPKKMFCPISGIICLPKELFCSLKGTEERHMDSTQSTGLVH